jgi:hypothetical protein
MSPIGGIDENISRPCVLSRSSVQANPDSVFTNVLWTQEITDADFWHDNATNRERITPRFTPPVTSGGGPWFRAYLQVKFASNTVGNRRARIWKSDGTNASVVAEGGIGASSVSTGPINLVAFFQLAQGEWAYCDVFQNSGGALDLDVSSTFTLW